MLWWIKAPNKLTGSGPECPGSGLSDMTTTRQTLEKQGFHARTLPPFSLSSALGSAGPLDPGTAPSYAPALFLHIMTTCQQPHSKLLYHHLPQDALTGSGQHSQPSLLQPKSQASKPTSSYWINQTLKKRVWALRQVILWAVENTCNTFLGAPCPSWNSET